MNGLLVMLMIKKKFEQFKKNQLLYHHRFRSIFVLVVGKRTKNENWNNNKRTTSYTRPHVRICNVDFGWFFIVVFPVEFEFLS